MTPKTEPALQLVFDEKHYMACRMPAGDLVLYRVGVRVIGENTIDNVNVMLKRFTPQNAHFLPVPLHPMHAGYNSLSTFTVHPGSRPIQFVDVVIGLVNGEIGICYHIGKDVVPLPNMIPRGHYVLTLLAQGRNIQACERDFVVEVDDHDQLLFCPIDGRV